LLSGFFTGPYLPGPFRNAMLVSRRNIGWKAIDLMHVFPRRPIIGLKLALDQ
jgi:hypothetical protein